VIAFLRVWLNARLKTQKNSWNLKKLKALRTFFLLLDQWDRNEANQED
jgi:hypothetical protein